MYLFLNVYVFYIKTRIKKIQIYIYINIPTIYHVSINLLINILFEQLC